MVPVIGLLPALVMGGAGLLGSIGSSLLSSSASKKANNDARQTQLDLLNLQQEYNTTMWNKNNEYNDPSNVYARYAALGINPNNIVDMLGGSGQSTQVATPSAPTPATVSDPASSAISGFSVFSNFLSSLAQIKNIEVQTQGQQIANDAAKLDLNSKSDFINLTKQQLSANINSILTEIDLRKSEKQKLDYEITNMLPVLQSKTLAERELIYQQTLNGVQELANAVKTGQLLGEKINTERATQSQIYEQIRGQQFDNQVKQLHARLASEYGIDINSGVIQLLTELALSGDDSGAAVVQRVLSTMTGVLTGSTDGTNGVLDEVFPKSRTDWKRKGLEIGKHYLEKKASPYVTIGLFGNRLFNSLVNP